MIIDYQHIGLLLVLAIAILIVARALLKKNKDASSGINLDDLLLGDDGKISKAATVMFGAFILTSWVILYQTLNKTLTDVNFAAYLAAWVAPAVTKLITGRVQQ